MKHFFICSHFHYSKKPLHISNSIYIGGTEKMLIDPPCQNLFCRLPYFVVETKYGKYTRNKAITNFNLEVCSGPVLKNSKGLMWNKSGSCTLWAL